MHKDRKIALLQMNLDIAQLEIQLYQIRLEGKEITEDLRLGIGSQEYLYKRKEDISVQRNDLLKDYYNAVKERDFFVHSVFGGVDRDEK